MRTQSSSLDVLLTERLQEIDGQLPEMAHRHLLVHHSLLALYAAIGVLVLTMCIIALTATVDASWVGPLVFGIFLVGVLMTLAGVLLITVEIRTSRRSLSFEVHRVSQLPVGVTTDWPADTVRS